MKGDSQGAQTIHTGRSRLAHPPEQAGGAVLRSSEGHDLDDWVVAAR